MNSLGQISLVAGAHELPRTDLAGATSKKAHELPRTVRLTYRIFFVRFSHMTRCTSGPSHQGIAMLSTSPLGSSTGCSQSACNLYRRNTAVLLWVCAHGILGTHSRCTCPAHRNLRKGDAQLHRDGWLMCTGPLFWGDGPTVQRWRTPIYGFLWLSAKVCGFLCLPNAEISRRRGESARIVGFLRRSAFWARSVTLGPSP